MPRAVLAHAQRGLALRAMTGVQGLGFLHQTVHAVQENALVPRAVLAHAQRGLALRAMTGVRIRVSASTTLWLAHIGQEHALVPRAVLARAKRDLALLPSATFTGTSLQDDSKPYNLP